MHGGADPGSNPMPTNVKTKSVGSIWADASRNETWFAIVLKALVHCHPPVPLRKLYELIEPHPKTSGRQHWRAKVRQTLELSDRFVRVAPGTWDLASRHPAKAIEKFDRRRRARHPRRNGSTS